MADTAKKGSVEPDYCDYCGGAVTGAEDEIECDGWTCRPDEEDDQ